MKPLVFEVNFTPTSTAFVSPLSTVAGVVLADQMLLEDNDYWEAGRGEERLDGGRCQRRFRPGPSPPTRRPGRSGCSWWSATVGRGASAWRCCWRALYVTVAGTGELSASRNNIVEALIVAGFIASLKVIVIEVSSEMLVAPLAGWSR